VLLFLDKGKTVDSINVGNWDRPALHTLLNDQLGLKRDLEMTYDKKNKQKEMDKAFNDALNKGFEKGKKAEL
jgi:hypothetical protein